MPNYDEGKTMGLAPFGDPEVYVETSVDMVARSTQNGAITIDLSYFDYQFWGAQRCSPKFFAAFGSPRKGPEFEDNHKNVAAAFQVVLEERALELCAVLRKRTKCRHLDHRRRRGAQQRDERTDRARSRFRRHLRDARRRRQRHRDRRGAVRQQRRAGPAPRRTCTTIRTWARRTPTRTSAASIDDCKLPAEKHDDIASVAARLVADGKIVGWFQGRMEIGPRALGNRTILANPTLPDMKDKINAEVKHREAFRPFAPSVLVEAKDKYFDVIGESPFMLKVVSRQARDARRAAGDHARRRLGASAHGAQGDQSALPRRDRASSAS